jgi:hypothetical protein
MGKGDRKRGRPPKPATETRYPSGRLTPKASAARREAQTIAQDARQTVWQARARHRGRTKREPVTKQEVETMQLNHRGDILGDWHADGHITAEELTAGRAFGILVGDYRKSHGYPSGATRSRYGEPTGGSGAEVDPAKLRALAGRYSAAQQALQRCGAEVSHATIAVCVEDEPGRLALVKAGIAALVASQAEMAEALGYGAGQRIGEIERGEREMGRSAQFLLRAYLEGYEPKKD